jgi:fumarate hydratase class II
MILYPSSRTADRRLTLVMALNPDIGNEKAAKIPLTAYHEDISLREAARKLGFLTGSGWGRRR